MTIISGKGILFNKELNKIPPGGSIEIGNKPNGNYASFNEKGEIKLYGESSQWDDLRFPFFGRNLDTSSGRIDYNYAELGVDFADNSRLNIAEQIGMIVQFPHSWRTGSNISPHLHWIQSSSNIPNWLIAYRWYDNGDIIPTTWTFVPYGNNSFIYVSGSIMQITEFDIPIPSEIDEVSSFLDIKFYRDTQNASGEFSGVDPLSGNALAKEFDIHFQIDSFGSNLEYIK